MTRKLLLLILVCCSLASCEKLLVPKKKSTNGSAVFNELWTVLDRGYANFGRKGVNWDSTKILYQGKFNDSMTDQQIFDSAAAMLNTVLHDGNVSLNSGFGISYYRETNQHAINFRKDILERNYWPGYEKTGPLIHLVKDSIGYIYYGSFNEAVTDQQMQTVIDRIKSQGGRKGVIIDIRDNDGGNPDYMAAFIDHLGPDSSTPFDYSAFLYEVARKNGPGHDDFDSYKGVFKDKNDNKKFANKVIVLTNRGVYGTASVFAGAAKGFGNVRLMGDTTGGGGSINATFELANGWLITYPAAKLRTGEGQSMDEGIIPYYKVQMTQADEDAGKDTILEAAFAEIKKP